MPLQKGAKSKGFAFVKFTAPENAVNAFTRLDGKIVWGRKLHIKPAQTKPEKLSILDPKFDHSKQRRDTSTYKRF